MSAPKPDRTAAMKAKLRDKVRNDPETAAKFRAMALSQLGAMAHARGCDVTFSDDTPEEDRQAVDEGYLAAAMFEAGPTGTLTTPPGFMRRLLTRALRRWKDRGDR